MKRNVLAVLVGIVAGCTEPPTDTKSDTDTGPTDTDTTDTDTDPVDTDTDPPQGQCGDVTFHDVVLSGSVEDAFGNALTGADLALEDRGWMPTTVMGTTVTANDGTFSMTIPGLISVEDCWGILLDYVLVGSTNLGHVGEDDVNPQLFDAVYSTDGQATMALPLVLDFPET